MVILGVILLVAGAVALVNMALTSNGSLDVHVLGWHLGILGPGRVLLLGAAIGCALTLGLVFVLAGLQRSRRRRRERERALKGTKAENERLAAQLEEQQARAEQADASDDDEAERVRVLPANEAAADDGVYPAEAGRGATSAGYTAPPPPPVRRT